METYQIIIKSGKHKLVPYFCRQKLQRAGFFTNDKRQYQKNHCCKKEIRKWERYANIKRLSFKAVNHNYVRSVNLKREWLKTHKSKYYLCAYCGFPIKADKVTVDHIIPIHKVQKSYYAKTLLKLFGSKSVNDTSNLCVACFKCNRKKSDKMGLWVLKGYLFKHKIFQLIRWIIRIVLLTLIVRYAIYYMCDMQIICRLYI